MMLEEDEVNRANLIAPIILLLFVGLIYYPSLDVDFVFDDMPNIVLNQAVHPESVKDLGRVLDTAFSPTRPLAMLSFALNYLAGGLDVFGYHLVNILIHGINAILVYLVLLNLTNLETDRLIPRLRRRERVSWSFYGAALWAVNPVQTQAVTYIVQRMSSLAAMFYLAAILAFILHRRGRLSGPAAAMMIIVSFVLGLGCKEIILSLPAGLLLLDFALFPEYFRKNRPWFLAGLAGCGLIGLYLLGWHLPEMTAPYPNRNFSPLERMMSQWRILWHYLGLFVIPLPSRLHLTYGLEPSRGLFTPWTTAAGLAGILITIAYAIVVRQKRPLFTLAILFYFLANAIEASFVNLELAFIHRLYLPTIFLPILILPGPDHPGRLKKIAPLLLLIIALFSWLTIQRNLEWNATPSFWNANIKRGADTARAKNNLAAALIDNGRLDEALPVIDKGLKIAVRDEDLAMLTYNRGYALFYLKRYPEAEEAFRKVAKRYGTYRHTYIYLGLLQLKKGNTKAAEKLAQALEKIPQIAYQAAIIRARIYLDDKRYQEAESALFTAREKTDKAPVYVRQRISLELARLYLKWGKAEAAYKIFLDIIRQFPQNYSAWRLIYLMLENGGDHQNAAKVKKFLLSKGVKLKQAR